MIKVVSSAPSDLFFPGPKADSKGITLLKQPAVNSFEVADLPPDVLKRFRIMHEDKHVTIETTEVIEPLDGLPAIFPKAVEPAASAPESELKSTGAPSRK